MGPQLILDAPFGFLGRLSLALFAPALRLRLAALKILPQRAGQPIAAAGFGGKGFGRAFGGHVANRKAKRRGRQARLRPSPLCGSTRAAFGAVWPNAFAAVAQW